MRFTRLLAALSVFSLSATVPSERRGSLPLACDICGAWLLNLLRLNNRLVHAGRVHSRKRQWHAGGMK